MRVARWVSLLRVVVEPARPIQGRIRATDAPIPIAEGFSEESTWPRGEADSMVFPQTPPGHRHNVMNTSAPINRREWITSNALGAAGCIAGAWSLPASGAEEKTAFSKPRIRVGQIGVGHAHATKLSVFRASPDFEVVGVAEPDTELRRAAADLPAYRGMEWMSVEALLGSADVQLVLVETRVRDLLSTAEACLAAGKPIHLDKPAGSSLPHFQRILAEAARRKLLVQMGYMYRYNPGVVMLREFLRQGWLGEIFEVHAVMSKVVDPKSRKQFAEFSGGILFELGGHIIDLVVNVLGEPERVTPFPRRTLLQADDPLMDNMLAVFEYPRATATVKSSALEVDGGDRRHLVVCGTEGTFHLQPLDDPSVKLTLSRPRGPYQKGTQEVSLPKYVRYVDDAADIARVLRGEKAAEFTYEHDLAVQRTLLRACGMPLRD